MPIALFRAPNADATPTLMFSRSISSMASLSMKSVNAGFRRSTHQSRGLSRACRIPSARTKAWEGPTPTPGDVDPSYDSASSGIVLLMVGGVGGMGVDTCPITMFSTDASDMLVSVSPVADALASALPLCIRHEHLHLHLEHRGRTWLCRS
jgi:hypothetical protein